MKCEILGLGRSLRMWRTDVDLRGAGDSYVTCWEMPQQRLCLPRFELPLNPENKAKSPLLHDSRTFPSQSPVRMLLDEDPAAVRCPSPLTRHRYPTRPR